jgi:carbonic anhydrase/acetyltransferase-like protein (isoleucine patch superfamily)
MTFLDRLSRSFIVKNTLTLIVYGFYAAVLGVSLAPSTALVVWAARTFLSPAVAAGVFPAVGSLVLFALFLGVAAFTFFFFGLFVMGSFVGLLARGISPGTYTAASLTVLLWMVLNGIWTLAYRLILPLVPMTPFSMMFHKLCGCRIGKNVWINAIALVDPYLISIGDHSVIGGDAVISSHIFENGKLTLRRITIGKKCLIGAWAYISPGVTVGDGAVVGMHAYVRKGAQVPAGTVVTGVGSMPFGRALDLERGTYRKIRSAMKN